MNISNKGENFWEIRANEKSTQYVTIQFSKEGNVDAVYIGMTDERPDKCVEVTSGFPMCAIDYSGSDVRGIEIVP